MTDVDFFYHKICDMILPLALLRYNRVLEFSAAGMKDRLVYSFTDKLEAFHWKCMNTKQWNKLEWLMAARGGEEEPDFRRLIYSRALQVKGHCLAATHSLLILWDASGLRRRTCKSAVWKATSLKMSNGYEWKLKKLGNHKSFVRSGSDSESQVLLLHNILNFISWSSLEMW